MRQRMLPDVLNALTQVKGADLNFFAMARNMLTEIIGPNIRNEVAHGLAEMNTFTKTNTELLILMLIYLSFLHIEGNTAEANS